MGWMLEQTIPISTLRIWAQISISSNLNLVYMGEEKVLHMPNPKRGRSPSTSRFFFFLLTTPHTESQFPHQRSSLHPLRWKHSLYHWTPGEVPTLRFLKVQWMHSWETVVLLFQMPWVFAIPFYLLTDKTNTLSYKKERKKEKKVKSFNRVRLCEPMVYSLPGSSVHGIF